MKISKLVMLGVSMSAAMLFAGSAFVSVHAVDAPSVKSRQEAEAYKKKQDKKELAEQKKSGCKYGKSRVTGKCYQPKEGQLYKDPKTGEMKMKEIEKVNLP